LVTFTGAALCLLAGGCATPAQTAALTAGVMAGGIATSGVTPSHELEQIYYLGIFDPDEQPPRSVYRLRVHGQSSPINRTRFASGWVPAKLIDALGSQVALSPEAQVGPNIQAAAAGQEVSLEIGRRMVAFGPEGTRPVPAGYRLVIVMGADPSKFFDAVDRALGNTSPATSKESQMAIQVKLFSEFQALISSRQKLDALKLQEATDLPKP
jgi:hypothetical protein